MLRDILSHRPTSLDLKLYSQYLGKKMNLNIEDLISSKDISQFIEALKNTEYYNCLNEVFLKGSTGIFDYALALDSYYFEICFKFANKELKGDEKKEVLSILGTRCDFLNMQWIYRTKKYYKVDNAKIYATHKKNNPYSLATLSYYLYFRELEISRVIEIIESIRYSLSSEDIITKILKLKARRSFA